MCRRKNKTKIVIGSTFKIADPDQRKNSHIGPDPDPGDGLGTSLDILIIYI